MDERGWIDLGKRQMVDLLEREHAVVWSEVEAKLSEPQNGPQPHLLTKARRELTDEGVITNRTEATRGGRPVTVWHFSDLTRRERAILDAAARKRLLQTRYLGWSKSRTRYPHGFLGPAAEKVLHSSLLEAAPYGYRLQNPDGGQVHTLLGSPVEGGPLDSAAFLQLVDDNGLPAGSVVVPFEVKNVRAWIYPQAPEPYQLLYKAAVLQEAQPDAAIVPVFICRRRSFFLWQMGKELGFFPVEVQYQYVLPNAPIDRAKFDEVRSGLGYRDLKLSDTAEPRLVQALAKSLPPQAQVYADRWKVCGPALKEYFADLRDYRTPAERAALMEDLRDEVRTLPGCEGRW